MRIETHDWLPPMAWLFHGEQGNGPIHVDIGASVHATEQGVFEGAWSGGLGDFAFDRAATVFGSGVRLRDEDVILVPPSHTLECIYVLARDGDVVASNSLSYVLEWTGAEVQWTRHIGAAFASIVRGIRKHDTYVMPTSQGRIRRLAFHNAVLQLDGDLQLHEVDKPVGPGFTDYATYRSRLLADLGAVFENATDPRRRAAFPPISTCSSGYDSAAATALASHLGCDAALTLARSRSGADDSGRDIVRHLGIELIECQRADRASAASAPEAEFLATGMGGEDYAYASFEPWLTQRTLVTGFPGGNWEKRPSFTKDLERRDVSGCSLTEFRLRVGFVHAPVAYIGAIHGDALATVSMSPEMEAYRIGGNYDKPVPRRIVEEAGVPRSAFGQAKKAASVLFHNRPELLSSDLRQRTQRMERSTFRGWDRHAYRFAKASFWTRYFVARAIDKVAKSAPARLRALLVRAARLVVEDVRTFQHDNPRSWFDLVASIDTIRNRYTQPE